MNSTNENNIVSLVDHINKKEKVTSLTSLADPSKLKKSERILFRRFAAFAIDIMSIIVIKTAIYVAYGTFIQSFLFMLSPKQQINLINGNTALEWCVTMLLFSTYFVFSHYSLEGKSIGKKVMKITTINDKYLFTLSDKDHTPSLRAAFRRSFGYFVCYLSFGTFFGFSLFSEDKRGVPDYLSQTRTVSDEWLNSMKKFKEFESETIQIDINSLPQAA